MKYLIVECHPSYAVALSEEGQFIKTANMGYETGMSVDSIFPMEEPTAKKKTVMFPRIMAVAACFVFMAASLLAYISLPYASVFITINPSVRIDIDRQDMVQAVEGTNQDGRQLVRGFDHKGKNLDTVVDMLVDRAINMGYLYDGGQISVTLEGDSTWVADHTESLTRHINRYVEEKITVTVQVGSRQQSASTHITIPATDTDYGESDYGQSDYDRNNDADSGYGESAYEESDYSIADSGRTDYGSSGYADTDSAYGQSSYVDSGYSTETSDKSESDYTQGSDYSEQQSDYYSEGNTDGFTDYGDSDYSLTDEYNGTDDSQYASENSDYSDEDSDYSDDIQQENDDSGYEESDFDESEYR